MQALEKAAPTDRFRGGIQFVERRTNAWSGNLGFLTGLGRSSVAIAEILGEGTSPQTVRKMWRVWDIQPAEIHATVPLTVQDRAMLTWRAGKRGMTPEAYLEAIVAAVVRDDLYAAIVDE